MNSPAGVARIDAYLPLGWRLFAWLERTAAEHPYRLLWLFILAHMAFWATAGSLLQITMTADNFEMAAWGREWQIGYWKHPPLPAWAIEIAIIVTGKAHWMPYVLSQMFVALTFWGIWKLAIEIVDTRRALLAVVFLAGVSAFDYEAFRFNHNISSLPWRALVAWSFYRGLRHGRMTDWLLLGVWMALGMLAKYDILFMLVPLAALAVIHPATRRFVATPGPYVAVAVALVLLAPHIVWRFEHGLFGAVDAPAARMGGTGNWFGHVVAPLDFAVNVAFMILPALIMALALRGGWRPARAPVTGGSFAYWYVAVAALSPLTIALGMALIAGLYLPEAWAVPMLDFVGLFAVVFAMGEIDSAGVRRFFATTLLASVIVLAATTWHTFVVEPFFLKQPGSSRIAGQEFADEFVTRWRDATGNAPLLYVVGAPDYAGRIAYYAPGRPAFYEDANLVRSPWIDPEDVVKKGAIVVWRLYGNNTRPPGWVARLPGAALQEPLTLRALVWGPGADFRIGWAIMRPQGG